MRTLFYLLASTILIVFMFWPETLGNTIAKVMVGYTQHYMENVVVPMMDEVLKPRDTK